MSSLSFPRAGAILALSLSRVISASPVAEISNGTILGSTSNGVDTFLGIPFAQPPVGNLRFRPPVPITTSLNTFNATTPPTACPQLNSPYDPQIFAHVPPEDVAAYVAFNIPPTSIGEDCLTLNVQRPSSATAKSKLPVLFWFYGGGFNTGSTQAFNWANFVTTSDALDNPIIVVQANYRLNAFGFLAGAQIKDEGSSNAGLHDQRLALQWVAENIEAFGGDPDRVTIWGESAGAVSVLYHTLIENGDNTYRGKPLFRAGILDSGSTLPSEPVDSHTAQEIFDLVANAAGCTVEAGEIDDRLTCLRSLPFEEFYNATSAAPGLFSLTGVNLSFPPRPDPSSSFFARDVLEAVQSKQLAHVPIITGNQADEGTLFGLALYNGTTTQTLVDKHLKRFYSNAPRCVLEELVNTYSTDPADGAPYGTGNANQLYLNYKRNSAVIGDSLFIFQRRHQLEHTVDLAPIWSFLATYNQTSGALGTGHGTDLNMLATGSPAIPYQHVLEYYISFVNYLDPNQLAGNARSPRLQWPKYTVEGNKMIQLGVDGETIIQDNLREKSYAYFKKVMSMIKV